MDKGTLQSLILENEIQRKEIFMKDVVYETFNYVMDIFKDDKNFSSINLIIINTFSKDCYIFKHLQEYYFVFNEYICEIFTQLNLIYLYDNPKTDIRKFICQIIAEELYSSSEYNAALYAILKGNSFIPYEYILHANKKKENIAKKYANIQQNFVIAHEIAHWYHSFSASDILKKRNALIKLFNQSDDTNNDFVSFIEKNDTIVEECVCDGTAIAIAVERFFGKYDAVKISEAILLGILHNLFLSKIKGCSNTFSPLFSFDFFTQSGIRYIHARNILDNVIEMDYNSLTAKDISEHLHDIFVNYTKSVHQNDIILNLIKECDIISRSKNNFKINPQDLLNYLKEFSINSSHTNPAL